MNKTRFTIFLLRISLGWFFFYTGITKVLNPNWSATGYLNSAKTFPELYSWLAGAQNIGWVNLLNEWGLTLVGVALILGIFVRWASWGGILLMAMYYLPALQFPYAGTTGFLVDNHVIFSLVFLLFFFSKAGQFWGLDRFLAKK